MRGGGEAPRSLDSLAFPPVTLLVTLPSHSSDKHPCCARIVTLVGPPEDSRDEASGKGDTGNSTQRTQGPPPGHNEATPQEPPCLRVTLGLAPAGRPWQCHPGEVRVSEWRTEASVQTLMGPEHRSATPHTRRPGSSHEKQLPTRLSCGGGSKPPSQRSERGGRSQEGQPGGCWLPGAHGKSRGGAQSLNCGLPSWPPAASPPSPYRNEPPPGSLSLFFCAAAACAETVERALVPGNTVGFTTGTVKRKTRGKARLSADAHRSSRSRCLLPN